MTDGYQIAEKAAQPLWWILMSPAEPLCLTSGTLPTPSCAERCFRWVPIVGWIIANELEKRRISLGLESLAQQLASRSMPETDVNACDDIHSRTAAVIARNVKESIGWPNDYFIADDPFELMLFGDDGAGVEVFGAIEDYLHIPRGTISDEHTQTCYKLTFGQVVEFLVSLSSKQDRSVQ